MKKLLLVCFILSVTIMAGYAANNPNMIPVVDIPESQDNITESETTLEALKTDNEQMSAENAQLVDEIKNQEKILVELKPMMLGMKERGEELLAVLKKILDKKASEQTRLAILKKNDLMRRMREKESEIRRDIYLKNQKIKGNKRRIVDNEKMIEKLIDRVTFLNAAVDKSKKLKKELNSYMTDMNGYLEQAKKYLEKSKNP